MWMSDKGERFKNPTGEPNYLSREGPFPANPNFKSENVLSEKSREEIWRRVVKQGEAIKAVSANFGVDMRRVAAVVRLKEVEKAWQREVSYIFPPFSSSHYTLCRIPRNWLQMMIHKIFD
jgi:hypothetical protein